MRSTILINDATIHPTKIIHLLLLLINILLFFLNTGTNPFVLHISRIPIFIITVKIIQTRGFRSKLCHFSIEDLTQ